MEPPKQKEITQSFAEQVGRQNRSSRRAEKTMSDPRDTRIRELEAALAEKARTVHLLSEQSQDEAVKIHILTGERDELEATVAKLREALEPFARAAKDYTEAQLNSYALQDLRRAARVLAETKP